MWKISSQDVVTDQVEELLQSKCTEDRHCVEIQPREVGGRVDFVLPTSTYVDLGVGGIV